MRTTIRFGIVCLAILVWTSANGGEISEIKAIAHTADSIPMKLDRTMGLLTQVRPDKGQMLVVVTVDWTIDWGNDSNFRVDLGTVRLINAAGKSDIPLGTMDIRGLASVNAGTLFLRKPTANRPHRLYNILLFATDATTHDFSLDVAGKKVSVTSGGKWTPPKPSDFVSFNITGTRWVETVDRKIKLYGDNRPTIHYQGQPAAGRLLAVTVEITPKKANKLNGNFASNSTEMGVIIDKNIYVPPCACMLADGGFQSTYNTDSPPDSKTGIPRPTKRTYLFAVPPSLRLFQFTYLMEPVANGTTK